MAVSECFLCRFLTAKFRSGSGPYRAAASSYMIVSVTWLRSHGSLSRVTQTFSHLGPISLSYCLTSFKSDPATSFCLVGIKPFPSFSRLAGAHFAYCLTYLATQRILFQFGQTIAFFPVCRQFINK